MTIRHRSTALLAGSSCVVDFAVMKTAFLSVNHSIYSAHYTHPQFIDDLLNKTFRLGTSHVHNDLLGL